MISIHAPTWGATFVKRFDAICIVISIHAPTWGATLNLTAARPTRSDFNPRTHVGCDEMAGRYIMMITISIHAPTWGATGAGAPECDSGEISIHAPTWGATKATRHQQRQVQISIHAPTWGATSHQEAHNVERKFQSTHPRGVRRTLPEETKTTLYFNPRTHVGCDPECLITKDLIDISIHAPTWGATHNRFCVSARRKFQSTHPRGVRHC